MTPTLPAGIPPLKGEGNESAANLMVSISTTVATAPPSPLRGGTSQPVARRAIDRSGGPIKGKKAMRARLEWQGGGREVSTGVVVCPLHLHLMLNPVLGAKQSQITRDLGRFAGGFLRIVGEFDRRMPVGVRHLADQ
jgi:hypothetical protein